MGSARSDRCGVGNRSHSERASSGLGSGAVDLPGGAGDALVTGAEPGEAPAEVESSSCGAKNAFDNEDGAIGVGVGGADKQ